MTSRTAWIVYTLLRLVFFAVPFAVLYLIGWHWLVAAVIATLVSVSLSIIFLSRQRETAAASVHAWRNRDRTTDDIVEDAAVDAEHGPGDGQGPIADHGPAAAAADPPPSERERHAE